MVTIVLHFLCVFYYFIPLWGLLKQVCRCSDKAAYKNAQAGPLQNWDIVLVRQSLDIEFLFLRKDFFQLCYLCHLVDQLTLIVSNISETFKNLLLYQRVMLENMKNIKKENERFPPSNTNFGSP